MEIHKFCIADSEGECIQCKDSVHRKRICPVYRIAQKQEYNAQKQHRLYACNFNSAASRSKAVEAAKKDFRKFLSEVVN